jgi:hypothetical protein
MGKTYDQTILNAAGLKVDANGQLSELDDIKYQREVNKRNLALADKISSAEAASARAAAVVSPEMEQANILWEKTKKYMPTMMKQAGLDGLGVSQTAMLRAQSDHNNLMGELARERNRAMSAAGGLTMDAYRAYVEQIEGENRALDLSEARIRARQIYEDSEWSDVGKEEAFQTLLKEFDGNAAIQNALLEDVKVYREDAKAMEEFEKLFAAGGEDGTVQPADYEEAAADAGFWDDVDEEELLLWYSNQTEGVQNRVDEYLEAIGAMSVEDKAEEMETADGNVMKLLLSYGAGYDESGKFIFGDVPIDKLESLLNDGSRQMSKGLRQSIEDHVEISKGRRMTEDENYLKARIESVDPKNLDAAGAKAYLEDLSEYLNDDNTPNLDRITQEFYDEHLKPELDSLEEWKKYLEGEAALEKETYSKQMAGDAPIEVGGKEWYVAKSPEGDVEAFMDENKEKVNKALGEYGKASNPAIPDRTVIKVGRAHLLFDKKSGKWSYVLNKDDKFDHTIAGFHYGEPYVSGGIPHTLNLVGAEDLKAIRKLDLGEKIREGMTVEIEESGRKKKVMHYNGKWYYAS